MPPTRRPPNRRLGREQPTGEHQQKDSRAESERDLGAAALLQRRPSAFEPIRKAGSGPGPVATAAALAPRTSTTTSMAASYAATSCRAERSLATSTGTLACWTTPLGTLPSSAHAGAA